MLTVDMQGEATVDNRRPLLLLAAVLAAGVLGCATAEKETSRESGGVQSAALDRPQRVTDLEPQDIHRMAERMFESLLSDPAVCEYARQDLPVLDIMPVKNKTNTELDTESVVDYMRMRLVRSRRFRLVDRSTAKRDLDIMDEQAQMLPKSKIAARPGQQLAAQMILDGTLTEIEKRDWKFSSPLHVLTDHSYKFTMRLKDLRTGEVVWMDEQEIRKVANLPFWK